ncbi:MAG TPA: hypothetical protein VJK47_00565, partial [Dehalococcoidales bacterium]|nr:hypothetical protein [Dehalococcoidales bacterium]
YVNENVIGTGIDSGSAPSGTRELKEMLKQAQERFMNSPSHRANILYKWHKKVSLGIAYDGENLQLVQHFEGDYIRFREVPGISGSILSMYGKVAIGTIERIVLHYDPLPQPLTSEQLNASPYDSSYSLGGIIGNVLTPPPPGSYYTNLLPTDVVATTWHTQADGSFAVKANIGPVLGKGKGVYTVAVLVKMGGELVAISNYSIFIR